MSSLRAVLLIAAFIASIGGGILSQVALAPGIPENPYRELGKTGEPEAAAQVSSTVTSGDARALAKMLDRDMLKQLGSALEPLVQIEETKFVGAVAKDQLTLAAYTAKGKDPRGNRFIVGYVLRVQGAKVVGVN